MSDLTWDEVRARSEERLSTMTVFCGDCAMVFPHSKLPCRKHATPDESREIDEFLLRTLSGSPLILQSHVDSFGPAGPKYKAPL